MSTITQRSKGPKTKQLICFNGAKFKTKKEAQDFINKLINKGRRGARGGLVVRRCKICSNKQGDVYHVSSKLRGRG